MPYIKQADRSKFADSIKGVLSVLLEGDEPQYIRGEYFGYFVNRLVRKYHNDPKYPFQATSFNSTYFAEDKRKTLSVYADKISDMWNFDSLGAAGELNYVISVVYWRLLGSPLGNQNANYGMRAYLTGILEKIIFDLQAQVVSGTPVQILINSRRSLVIRGVLRNVLDEAYRQLTVPYEDAKMSENGTLWGENGELINGE